MARPSLGRKNKVTLYLTDDEKLIVRSCLDALRDSNLPDNVKTFRIDPRWHPTEAARHDQNPISNPARQRGYKPE